MTGGQFQQQTTFSKWIFASVAYAGLSILMTILNKVLMIRFYFDFPVVILMCQLSFTLVLLSICRCLKFKHFGNFTIDRSKRLLLPSLFFVLHSVFSLNALTTMSLPIYTAVKRCVPIVNMIFAALFLKKPSLQRGEKIAVWLITVGAIIASFSDINLNWWAILYGLVAVVAHAAFLCSVEHLSSTTAPGEYTTIDILYGNAFIGLIFLILLQALVFQGEIRDAAIFTIALPNNQVLSVYSMLLLLLVCGVALQLSNLHLTSSFSALATSLVGNIKASFQTLIGYYVGVLYFQDVTFNFWNITGISINLLGCIIWNYVKYKNSALSLN